MSLVALLKHSEPLCTPCKPFLHNFCRTLSSSPSTRLQEAVGLIENSETETQNESNELKRKLWESEKEVRVLREAQSRTSKEDVPSKTTPFPTSLLTIFAGKNVVTGEMKRNEKENEEVEVSKEWSPEMEAFVSHLYKEGYFRKANFLKTDELNFRCFGNGYSKSFIKFAAVEFGKDHQEIAKWLSGSDLKKVALFGCPSLLKKNIFSAKRLRLYFGIKEDTVCSKCNLRNSCKFVNQSVWKGDINTLNLAAVMRVIILYGIEEVHPNLSVPHQVKASVNRLLKELKNLTQTTPSRI
ncbi:hypothetical protein K2173_018012 [Erythroxylum novogranatense]|uniref:Uncharacterized protein n=1 Tax=Erythroxylum novogranatense TaxID=1862640 RepID=A0AAV8TVL2_9ROSI|nr:hypothetical protein K2173_018012 [Erythroxylum novogranatense]